MYGVAPRVADLSRRAAVHDAVRVGYLLEVADLYLASGDGALWPTLSAVWDELRPPRAST